ncbi:hypothetical protein D3C76_999050 [compost metagenome]
MAVDVLSILRLGTVDVTRQVEIEVVLRIADFVEGHHSGIARVACIQSDKGIDNLVHVLIAQAILRAVLDEALGGIDHENAFARTGVFLVQDQDASGNACAEKQVGRQADNGFEVTGPHQLLTDHGLGIAAKQHAVGQNARTFTGTFQ